MAIAPYVGCGPVNAHVRFKQIDVTRAARGAVAAGLPVSRIEIDGRGKIVIFTAPNSRPQAGEPNEWDEELK